MTMAEQALLAIIEHVRGQRFTDAERLVDEADDLLSIAGLAMGMPGITESDLARIALGLKVKRMGPGFLFRAVFEEWTQQDIVRELY